MDGWTCRSLREACEAYRSEPKLAAWIHAERAWFLEWRLGDVRAARSALERAVELNPEVGPIRNMAVRHVAAHDDSLALAVLLKEEAELEQNPVRAARLELDASSILSGKSGRHVSRRRDPP